MKVKVAVDRFGIFVLGAGFSCRAGLPLATELWKEVRRRAEAMQGRASRFDDDLQTYIEFRRRCDGVKLTKDDVNFEEFLGFLDVEYHLGLRGPETLSADGNETQVLVKTLIGQVLAERTPKATDLPDLYLRFAERLRPNDYVLTFNYDLVLERALEEAGVPFRLFPTRYQSLSPDVGIGVVDDSRSEVIVLKLHGSIDWFDRKRYREHEAQSLAAGLSAPEHRVFNAVPSARVIPLVDGPRLADDPLVEMYRLVDIEQFYRNAPFFSVTPSLILPSTAKVIFARQFGDFWRGLGQRGTLNMTMAIIGFSLPPHDEYTRQVIYGLVKRYQEEKTAFGKRKQRLSLVDFRQGTKEQRALRRRYSFVNWRRANVHFEGFNERVLAML